MASTQKRRSWRKTVADHAALSAKNGAPVYSCPYKHNPHRTVWLREFGRHAQMRLKL